ncbi:MAG: tripartite tricarboxylate transporter permease, partial [Halanaeroarchaeum sp.]
MEVIGVRIVTQPGNGLVTLGFIGAGILLGAISGLTPGLHVNTIAVIMASVAPHIPAPPHLIGASMLAAGVTHSFLDVVPTLAIGVPDAAMAVSALPGHRLVMGGRGHETLRISAIGSATAVIAAAVFGVPVTLFMRALGDQVDAALPFLIVGIAVLLVATEPGPRGKVGGILALAASGILGLVLLDVPASGVLPGGDVLLPLLSGLFGVPVLVHAYYGAGVPRQGGPAIAWTRRAALGWGMVGATSGAIVAYVPGVTAAVAAAMSLVLMPTETGDREFVATVSGVNTSNALFGLFALVALGTPRNGVLVAFERAKLPPNVPLLLLAMLLAAAVSFVLVPVLGDRYLRVVGSFDPRR